MATTKNDDAVALKSAIAAREEATPTRNNPLSELSSSAYNITLYMVDATVLNKFIESKYVVNANTQAGQTGTQWAKENVYGYFNRITQTNDKLNTVISIDEIQLDANTYANTATSSTNTYTLQDGNRVRIETVKFQKSYFEYEDDLNEEKRLIKIVKPEFVADIEEEFRKANE